MKRFIVFLAFGAGILIGALGHRYRVTHAPPPPVEIPSRADKARIEAFRHRAESPAPIVLFGDSLTDFWRDYPDLCERYLADAANFGVAGSTWADVTWRIRNVGLRRMSPRVVVLMAGINDLNTRTPARRLPSA